MKHVCYFRHALALDEWRVKFLPEYVWEGSHYYEDKDGAKTTEQMKENGKEGGIGMDPQGRKTAELTEGKGKERGTGTESQGKETTELIKGDGKEGATGTDLRGTETTELMNENGKEAGTGMDQQPRVKEVWFAGTHADV
jgi:hypothetical protein